MRARPSNEVLVSVAALSALAGVLALATWLRLLDPLANPVMAAEDPYTHMSIVREHLRDGVLDPQNAQGALYPPGLHALVATLWVASGVELYQLMRLAPVLFGVVGVAGLALLLWRFEGPLAAVVGALALAAMPEVVFRAGMMSPTALDLMVIPFLFWSLLELVRGELAWLGAAVPLAAFLVLAHPWILAILALAGLFFLAVYLLFPWRASRGAPVTREGAAAAVAVLGGSFGIALATRWEASGTGFSELTLPMAGNNVGVLGAMAVAAAGLVAFILLTLPQFVRDRLPRLNERPRPTSLQVAGALLMALALLALTVPALQRGTMPEHVDLPRMLGWPALALAGAAFVLLPVAGGPAAHAGVALLLATYPFTIYNPLDSPFWPHRTAVFLGLAAAMLSGVMARRLADAWPRLAHGLSAPSPRSRSLARAGGAPLLATLLVASTVGASIVAETPEPYPGGWYRYYNAEEFATLRHVADRAQKDPGLLVVAGSWQGQLVVSAFTDNASRVWFKEEFFQAGFGHEGFVAESHREGRAVLVVLDRYLAEDVARPDTGFLQQSPWHVAETCCTGHAADTPRIVVYELG
jgi:hypothetical protein